MSEPVPELATPADALQRLIRAGVITHIAEVSDAADCLEQDAVTALLSVVGQSMFRIAPFQYGLDLSGTGGQGDAAAVLTDRLAGILGAGIVALTPVAMPDPAPGAEYAEAVALNLVRAVPDAVGGALEREGPGLRAAIDAGYAVAVADLTARHIAGLHAERPPDPALTTRLDGLDAGLGGLARSLDRLEAEIPSSLGSLGEGVAGIAAWCAGADPRLDAIAAQPAEAGKALDAEILALKEGQAALSAALDKLCMTVDGLAADHRAARAEAMERDRLMRHALAELLARGDPARATPPLDTAAAPGLGSHAWDRSRGYGDGGG